MSWGVSFLVLWYTLIFAIWVPTKKWSTISTKSFPWLIALKIRFREGRMDFLDTDGDCIQFLIDPKGKLRERLGIFLHYIECNEMSPLFLFELKQLWIHRITDENKLFKGRKHDGLAKNGKTFTPRKLTWQWKIAILNRRYIFKWLVFHDHVTFPGVYLPPAYLVPNEVCQWETGARGCSLASVLELQDCPTGMLDRWYSDGGLWLHL